MTQKEKIMQYLRQHGEITIKEAIYELGITQSATRIKELIEEGYPVERREWRTVTRRDGTETQVRVYRLKSEPKQIDAFGQPQQRNGAYSQ